MGGRRGMNVWTALVTHHDMRLCHARGSVSRVSVVTCRKQLKWYPISIKWKRKCSQSTEVFIFSSPCGWGRGAEVSDSWLSPVLRPETISHEPGPGSVRGSRHFYLVYWLRRRTFFLENKAFFKLLSCFDACCFLIKTVIQQDAVF